MLFISITIMKAFKSQIKKFNKVITAHMKLLPNILTSISGINSVFSSGIRTEIEDIDCFESHAQLTKHTELAWKQHQSGGFEAQTTELLNSGIRFSKYYLCETAWQGIQRLLPPQIPKDKQISTQTCTRINYSFSKT